jgi:hypothetical protein
VPSLSSRSDQHFRAALDAGARAGSSLSDLAKIVADLSGGLTGAKSANEQLVQELSTLRAMLGSANEQQLALQHRVATLEQELISARNEAEQERQFLTQQHDDFLSALLDEHEEEIAQSQQGATLRMNGDVSDLAQQLVKAETARLQAEAEGARARDALSKVKAQRDEAQARAEKRERERDELRAEASQLRAGLGVTRSPSASAPPPPVVSSRPPSFRPPALRLDAEELDSTLHGRSSSSRLPAVQPRLTPTPPELHAAVYPRESTRPGVGGPKPSSPSASEPPPFDDNPAPSGWTPVPPAPDASTAPPPRTVSAASLPGGTPSMRPVLKPKLDPSTRPLTDYSLGGDSETLEGVRLSSKPPRK